jgi:hypothetical protein
VWLALRLPALQNCLVFPADHLFPRVSSATLVVGLLARHVEDKDRERFARDLFPMVPFHRAVRDIEQNREKDRPEL